MNQPRINIAVVEDDNSFARSLERLFRASGFEVRTYPSAEAYLSPTPPPQPDCLVIDIQLGGMSGLDLQRRLHEFGFLTPIIFVTAHDAPSVREQAQRDGCSAYLLKPVLGQALLEAIAKAVKRDSREGRDDVANGPDRQ